MTDLEKLFNEKLTENGDRAYKSTGDELLDIFFMSAYYEKHLDRVNIGNSDIEKVFSMFIRDPRYGLGRRDLGRELMKQSMVSPENIVKAGRFDDLISTWYDTDKMEDNLYYLKQEVLAGNELAKKWCPRLTSKDRYMAKYICRVWGVSEKEYRKMIKCDTTESKLSQHRTDEINFEHVPSLAMIKYYDRFSRGEDTAERFEQYLEDVKSGKKKLNITTTNVYDIYRNRFKIDADLFFDKIDKIQINCIPIVDVSGSMYIDDDLGKALSIGHYLAKCSTYCKDEFITFSADPELVKIHGNSYKEELSNMNDCGCGSNTDFGKVMELLKKLGDVPEYLIVLSDMEFDEGSCDKKDELMEHWKKEGINTKIVWWNFNARHTTAPEIDEYGNIFMSGYNPTMLEYIKVGFDGKKFLKELLLNYIHVMFDENN